MDQKAIARTNSTKKLDSDIRDRFVRQEDFYKHLNETVFKPALGVELSKQAIKDIVYGLGDQVATVALAGGRVRLGKLGTFMQHRMPSGSRYNPVTKSSFDAPERLRLVFRCSKSTKRIFCQVSIDVVEN
jgi:nucleoid DNA-binding protein